MLQHQGTDATALFIGPTPLPYQPNSRRAKVDGGCERALRLSPGLWYSMSTAYQAGIVDSECDLHGRGSAVTAPSRQQCQRRGKGGVRPTNF